MAQFLGIDYGKKRIGLASGDASLRIAFPLCVLDNSGRRRVVEEISRIVREREVTMIVVGLPLKFDGTSGIAAENVKRFADVLKKHINVPVEFWDERFSSKIAERAMIEGGLSRERRKQSIDQSAAQIVLQSYLDAHAKV